jgi:hypothetical protein
MKPIKPTKSESSRKREHKLFGRPQMNADEHRSVKVSVFLTQSEAEKLKEKAAETLLTLPELLRRAALGRQIEIRKSVFDAEAVSEIRKCSRMTRNLSSGIRLMRETDSGPDIAYLKLLLVEQLTLLSKLKKQITEE